MAKRKKIELDGETADRIAVLSLKEHLEILENENAKLIGKEKLEKHHQEDLASNLGMIAHLKAVLAYYGVKA